MVTPPSVSYVPSLYEQCRFTLHCQQLPLWSFRSYAVTGILKHISVICWCGYMYNEIQHNYLKERILYLQLNNIQNTLLRFCSNNGQANQPQCYTTHTLLICLRSSITSCIPKYSQKNENSKAGKLSILNRDHNNKDKQKKISNDRAWSHQQVYGHKFLYVTYQQSSGVDN